jgi:fructokinase
MPFLVLGEALVDLICEQPADGIGDANAFVPHFGGAAANVAVNAARAGGRVALAGGVTSD